MEILKSYNKILPYIDMVSDEADKNNMNLGFLPKCVYHQLGMKDCLWVLVNDKTQYVGHILFSFAISKSKITVQQTYILPQFRGLGYAKQLVKELKLYGEKQQVTELIANVADDLREANEFYNSMGFIAVMQKDGGQTTKRKINVRVAYLDTPTLFSLKRHNIGNFTYEQPINTFHKYVMDLNILLDLIKKRQDYKDVTEIIKCSFNGDFKLFITPEAKQEIVRNSKTPEDPLAELVKNIPMLPSYAEIEKTAEYNVLKQKIFGTINPSSKSSIHKISDLKHLTYCLLNKCSGFITRDENLLKKSPEIFNLYGVEIISPEEFAINEDCVTGSNTVINFDNSKHIFKNISDDTVLLNDYLQNFNITRQDVPLPTFSGVLIEADRNYYPACAVWTKLIKSNKNMTAYIFANSSCNEELLDHLIEVIFRTAKSNKAQSIAIITQGVITHIDEVLRVRGFYTKIEHNNQVKYSHLMVTNIITSDNWRRFCKIVKEKMNLILPEKLADYYKLANTGILLGEKSEYYNFFDFETKFSPSIIVPRDRNIHIISIRPEYAKELVGDSFDYQKSLDLMYKKPALLKTEKAYFRKPKGNKIKKGDLLLFYVSSTNKSIIGLGRVTYSDTIEISEAKSILRTQGVLEDKKLEELSKDGTINVITFDNFQQFKQNVPIEFLRTLDIGKNNFITSFQIASEKFLKICKQGGIYE